MSAFALALTMSLATASLPPSLDNAFSSALDLAGLSPESARFDANLLRFFRQSEFANPLFEAGHENPWRMPLFVDSLRSKLEPAIGRPSDSVSALGLALGAGTRRTLLGNPIESALAKASKPGSLKSALDAMRSLGLISRAAPSLDGIPTEVQQACALILQVAMDSVSYRRAAFSQVADLDGAIRRQLKGPTESDDPETNQLELALDRKVDMSYLYAAGHDLALAATTAEAMIKDVDPAKRYSFVLNTHWGVIDLSGASNSTHSEATTLLVIDTGGNDVYVDCASNRSSTNWLSACIDTNGNDAYLSSPSLRSTPVADWGDRKAKGPFGPASAQFGVSVLVDSRGSDLYRTHRPGLSSATYGVSVLLDLEGDDVYDSYINAEGFGMFGIGVLEDTAGSDTYLGFNQAQGHGGVGGAGLLLDRAGDDTYSANDTVIDFPSPQSKEHNVSMAQGAGYGRRADYLDGHSLSGGIGILFDQKGHDKYSCGVFGQGVGYWEGTGILIDAGGNDAYLGQWYVQGASAHFATGYLEDDGGDDRYTALMNMAQGAGHDFGAGYLLDMAGNDIYRAPNLSLGAGNANGIGVFVDLAGNDRYESKGMTLGKAAEAAKGTLRERALCLGIFIDLAGSDVYPAEATWALDGKQTVNWTEKRAVPAESQVGVFMDR